MDLKSFVGCGLKSEVIRYAFIEFWRIRDDHFFHILKFQNIVDIYAVLRRRENLRLFITQNVFIYTKILI